jgi:hypothetical protein
MSLIFLIASGDSRFGPALLSTKGFDSDYSGLLDVRINRGLSGIFVSFIVQKKEQITAQFTIGEMVPDFLDNRRRHFGPGEKGLLFSS